MLIVVKIFFKFVVKNFNNEIFCFNCFFLNLQLLTFNTILTFFVLF